MPHVPRRGNGVNIRLEAGRQALIHSPGLLDAVDVFQESIAGIRRGFRQKGVGEHLAGEFIDLPRRLGCPVQRTTGRYLRNQAREVVVSAEGIDKGDVVGNARVRGGGQRD